MQFEFIKQRIDGNISTEDIIELYNCEDRQLNGNYTVARIDVYGDVMLVGMGSKSGYITTINMFPEED